MSNRPTHCYNGGAGPSPFETPSRAYAGARMRGRDAVNGLPSDGSVVISIVDAKSQGSLYLWIADKSGPRGYRLPYSDSLARELLKADRDARGGGGMMILHLKKKGTPGKDGKLGEGKPANPSLDPLLGDDARMRGHAREIIEEFPTEALRDRPHPFRMCTHARARN